MCLKNVFFCLFLCFSVRIIVGPVNPFSFGRGKSPKSLAFAHEEGKRNLFLFPPSIFSFSLSIVSVSLSFFLSLFFCRSFPLPLSSSFSLSLSPSSPAQVGEKSAWLEMSDKKREIALVENIAWVNVYIMRIEKTFNTNIAARVDIFL
jgi:hypothetical protein